jgi:ribonuclease Y
MDMGVGPILAVFFSFVIGVVFGGMAIFLFRRFAVNRQIRLAQRKAAKIEAEASEEAKKALNEAKREVDKVKSSADADYRERRSELQRQENRLSQKTEALDRKLEGVEQRERNLTNKEKEATAVREELDEIRAKQLKQLETISGLSTAEAKKMFLDAIEAEMEEETSRRLREWEANFREEADKKAQDILSQAIQRCASEVVSETTVAAVPLPSDEMKGRLIGREGRNIRALEQATGVDLIVDDTP